MKCIRCRKEALKYTNLCKTCKEKIYDEHNREKRKKKHLTIKQEFEQEEILEAQNGTK